MLRISQSSSADNRLLSVCPDGIPEVLRQLPQWVAWSSQPRGPAKSMKVPISPQTGQRADVTRPGNHVGFDDAYDFYLDRHLSGVGFVFRAADPFAGIDLDACRDPNTGDIDPFAVDILTELSTYAEVSPSGTGAKAIAIGSIDPAGRKRAGNVEMYDRARYFALTGHRLPFTSAFVEPREEMVRRLQDRLRPPEAPGNRAHSCGHGFDGADQELLDRAFAARNGARVEALWNGRIAKTPSEALLGLARQLAFWTGPDEYRLNRLLTGSPLFGATELDRVKWLLRRQGGSWGLLYVVRKAIGTCPEFFGSSRLGNLANGGTQKEKEREKTQPCVSRHGMHFAGLSSAWNRVLEGVFPEGLDKIPGRSGGVRLRRQKLAALCWHLSRQNPSHQFFLAEADAGRLLGVSQPTIGRWLKAFRSKPLRLLHRIRQGNSFAGRASEYLWLPQSRFRMGPQVGQTATSNE